MYILPKFFLCNTMSFLCNITGNRFDLEEHEKDRELGNRFGYNCRFRAICYVLCKVLYGDCKLLNALVPDKTIKGIGMSDSGWATILKEKFDYTNTFYHTSPHLDIYNDEHVNTYTGLDFIISSDVFEHIDPYPSIQSAFSNLYKMLKPGGSLVFSVPFTHDEHKEHFPNLYSYKIHKTDNGEYVLHNTTIDHKTEVFGDLCFHGGPGNVLEMRIFSKKSVTDFLENSGFVDIVFYEITEDMKKYGIFWSKDDTNDCSLIISAKKPMP